MPKDITKPESQYKDIGLYKYHWHSIYIKYHTTTNYVEFTILILCKLSNRKEDLTWYSLFHKTDFNPVILFIMLYINLSVSLNQDRASRSYAEF